MKTEKLKIVGTEDKQTDSVVLPTAAKPKLSFDAWWAQAQQNYKLKPELQNTLKRHFESRGFMASQEFDKGLKDFGL
ncbi:MAG: hypothetical protein ACREGB_03370 [Candidatus Saccharimonadales bacterium]